MNKEIKRVILLLVFFCIMFIGLIVYMSYFQVFLAEDIKTNPYNKRLWINEENTLRGSILDRNGNVLAYSEKKEDSNIRYYNYKSLYSHSIGYSYREYGKAGLELHYNNELLDISENKAINEFKNIIAPSTVGNTLKLTLDHNTQVKAKELLNGRKGSVIAMNPKTGEVYAMVSLPDFDTSNLKTDWKTISEDTSSPLLNRAISGLYTPGSVFKVITATAALESENLNKDYDCTGISLIDGYTFKDYQGNSHGNIDLKGAVAKSCNTYFTEKSILIGKHRLKEVSENFMFNNKIPFDLPITISKSPFKDNIGETEIAAASIGQGKVLTTPINMALVASAIANNGEMVKPILVKEVISKTGKIIRTNDSQVISNVTDIAIADEINEMLIEVIKNGTGINASIKNVQVAGKTGTAENSSGMSHAWFIGYAPAENPKIAIAVVLEEDGSTGGSTAAPLARDLIIYALNNINF